MYAKISIRFFIISLFVVSKKIWRDLKCPPMSLKLNGSIMVYTYNGIPYSHLYKKRKLLGKLIIIKIDKKVLYLGSGSRSLENLVFTLFFSAMFEIF